MDNENKNVKVNPLYYNKSKEKYSQFSQKQKKDLITSVSWFFLTDNIKKKNRLSIQAKMKLMDICSIILATIGVITNVLQSYLYIQFTKTQTGGKTI